MKWRETSFSASKAPSLGTIKSILQSSVTRPSYWHLLPEAEQSWARPPPRAPPGAGGTGQGSWLSSGITRMTSSRKRGPLVWGPSDSGKATAQIRWESQNPALTLCALGTRACLTLCDPMDCSPPGSRVHGLLQAGTLERVATSFSALTLRTIFGTLYNLHPSQLPGSAWLKCVTMVPQFP